MRIPRSRGAVSGVVLVVAGLWGGFIPFVGPYFSYSVGSDKTWMLTHNRWWLDILPAAATVIGGLLLIRAATRASGGVGGWLALAGGVWFVIGPNMSRLWEHGAVGTGRPLGPSTGRQVIEQLGYYEGLGALICAVAAFALGRLAVRSVRDAELAKADAAGTAGTTRRRGLLGRRRREEPVAADGRGPGARTTTRGTTGDTAPRTEQTRATAPEGGTRTAGDSPRDPNAEPPAERR